jgi:hypothetical protein
MKLKMLKTVPGSRDGGHTNMFDEGEVYSFDESLPREMELAKTFTSSGFAAEISDADAEKHIASMKEAAVAHRAKAREERKAEREEKKAAKAKKQAEKVAASAKPLAGGDKKPEGGDKKPEGDDAGDKTPAES